MNFFLEKAHRLWVILLGVLIGIIVTYYVIKPKLLEPLGFVNTNRCLKIFYKTNGNTVLVFVEPINRWFWYTDNKIYVYGDAPNKYCNNPVEYSPTYVLDVNQGDKGIGYQCVQNLDNVKKFYEDGKDWDVIFHCLKQDDAILTVQDIFNILLKKRIIFD